MKRSDYYDRSYDFSEIEDDLRLRNAAKEMHITFWAYAAYTHRNVPYRPLLRTQ